MDRSVRRRSTFGRLLRHWRTVGGLSQLALALRMQSTTRHLSYVENGRSRPGREMVLRLAEALDVPLRGRNELLAAAGLAIEFPASPIESPLLAPYRTAVLRIIESVHPFPAFVIDAIFNLRDANRAGRRLMPALADHGRTGELGLARGMASTSRGPRRTPAPRSGRSESPSSSSTRRWSICSSTRARGST